MTSRRYFLLAVFCGLAPGCHDEPTFVITFAPQDIGATGQPDAAVARSKLTARAAGPTGGGATELGAAAADATAAGRTKAAAPATGETGETGEAGGAATRAAKAGGAATEAEVKADGAGECRKASDCMLVAGDCCGCGGGGRQIAIARAKKRAYEEAHAHCAGTSCIAMISTDPSCSLAARCVAGRCALVEAARK